MEHQEEDDEKLFMTEASEIQKNNGDDNRILGLNIEKMDGIGG